jgi:soluble lytic murein transglycosylase-like protein
MRRLITRGRLRMCGVALTGIAVMGLIGLTALQPVPQNGRPRVDSFALARDLGSVSAALASSSTSVANAASASPTATSTATSTAVSSPAATAASTVSATAVDDADAAFVTEAVPSPLPVTIVRTPPTAPPTSRPAPASTGTSSSGGDIEAIITAAAQAEGIDPSWLISTAECESGLNPNASNGAGPYDGLFQFLPSTFAAHGGGDIWDPTQQAQIAATMFANGESGEWPVCSR